MTDNVMRDRCLDYLKDIAIIPADSKELGDWLDIKSTVVLPPGSRDRAVEPWVQSEIDGRQKSLEKLCHAIALSRMVVEKDYVKDGCTETEYRKEIWKTLKAANNDLEKRMSVAKNKVKGYPVIQDGKLDLLNNEECFKSINAIKSAYKIQRADLADKIHLKERGSNHILTREEHQDFVVKCYVEARELASTTRACSFKLAKYLERIQRIPNSLPEDLKELNDLNQIIQRLYRETKSNKIQVTTNRTQNGPLRKESTVLDLGKTMFVRELRKREQSQQNLQNNNRAPGLQDIVQQLPNLQDNIPPLENDNPGGLVPFDGQQPLALPLPEDQTAAQLQIQHPAAEVAVDQRPQDEQIAAELLRLAFVRSAEDPPERQDFQEALSFSRKRKEWSSEQLQWLNTMTNADKSIKGDGTLKTLHLLFNERFKSNYSLDVIRDKLIELDLYIPKARVWSTEEDKILRSNYFLYSNNKDLTVLLPRCNEDMIRKRAKALGLPPRKASNYTGAEEDRIIEMASSGMDDREIADELARPVRGLAKKRRLLQSDE